MATTFADLEARIRGIESRMQRTEEDVTAIITTVIETRDDVKWLKRAVQALLADRNITIERITTSNLRLQRCHGQLTRGALAEGGIGRRSPMLS